MAGPTGGSNSIGGMAMMNNGTNGAIPRAGNEFEPQNYEARLHSYIYDYFVKNEHWECARSLITSGLNLEPPLRLSDGDVNGTVDGPMHTDSKDGMDSKRPSDLPQTSVAAEQEGNSFLLEWFALFWDVYHAQKKSRMATHHANLYVQHSQVGFQKRKCKHHTLITISTATSKNPPRTATGAFAGHAWHDEPWEYEL